MTNLFRSTVPVFKIDGEVAGSLARDIVRLDVDESTSGMKTLTARFLAQGPKANEAQEKLLYLDGEVLDFGKILEVSIGDAAEQRVIFKGAMSALEASFSEGTEPEVEVFAEDKLMALRMTRRMKTYRQKSDADIARDIANEHGLSVEADADGPTYDVVQQWNQSDLAFLRERAALIQAELWFQDDKLYFKSRGSRAATDVTLVRGNQLLEVQLRADLAHQRTKVKVSGYDASARDKLDEEAASDAVSAEVSGGRTGPSVLERAFGERVSYRVREVPLLGGEAQAWAKQEMLRRARGFVSVVGVTDGTTDLIVGSKLTLQGVGKPFEGDPYYVTRVHHSYDLHDGHRTRFEAERATLSEDS
jgi:phage protein D